MNEVSIVNISLESFKKLLSFLDNTVTTKLLYYNTCYGAGINADLIYHDNETGTFKKHSFTIINQALTDTWTYGVNYSFSIHNDIISITSKSRFDTFLEKISEVDFSDYKKLVNLLYDPTQKEFPSIAYFPQIKYPGANTFTVLNEDKAIIFDSTVTKGIQDKLDVDAFFKKKYPQSNELLAILLSEKNINFELILNSKNQKGHPTVPDIISIIPDNAIHHIKKISTQRDPTTLLLAFIRADQSNIKKIFIIDELEGVIAQTPQFIHDVVEIITTERRIRYAKINNVIYKTVTLHSQPHLTSTDEASSSDKRFYGLVLKLNAFKKEKNTEQDITKAHNLAIERLKKPLLIDTVVENIFELLNTIPNDVALRVPKLQILIPSLNMTSIIEVINKLSTYEVPGTQKIVWIEKLEIHTNKNMALDFSENVILENIIIHADQFDTTVFATVAKSFQTSIEKIKVRQSITYKINENYNDQYSLIFNNFEKSNDLLFENILCLKTDASPISTENLFKYPGLEKKFILNIKYNMGALWAHTMRKRSLLFTSISAISLLSAWFILKKLHTYGIVGR